MRIVHERFLERLNHSRTTDSELLNNFVSIVHSSSKEKPVFQIFQSNRSRLNDSLIKYLIERADYFRHFVLRLSFYHLHRCKSFANDFWNDWIIRERPTWIRIRFNRGFIDRVRLDFSWKPFFNPIVRECFARRISNCTKTNYFRASVTSGDSNRSRTIFWTTQWFANDQLGLLNDYFHAYCTISLNDFILIDHQS